MRFYCSISFGVLTTVLHALNLLSQPAGQFTRRNQLSLSTNLSSFLCYYLTAEVPKDVSQQLFTDVSLVACRNQEVRYKDFSLPEFHDKVHPYFSVVSDADPTRNQR